MRVPDHLGITNKGGREPSVERKFQLARELAALSPFETEHTFVRGDARAMTRVADDSVHLIVTSPPYFDLVEYREHRSQLGHIHDYERFLRELDKVWQECWRVLIPGGRMCIVVGDVCRSRRRHGVHEVIPLHSDIAVRLRTQGWESVATVFWQKIANVKREASGRGVALGKPYEPNGVVKNDVEFILRLRKPGPYRKPSPLQRTGSIIPRDDYHNAMRQVWTDIPGSSRKQGHPAPFPVTLAERLVLMHSYVEDTILDPFAGTGSLAIAAMNTARNSLSYEIDADYASKAVARARKAAKDLSPPAEVRFDKASRKR